MRKAGSRQYAVGSHMLSRGCLVVACLIFIGCGRPPGESHITGHTPEQKLGDFAQLYRCVQDNLHNKQPPSRLQELDRSKSGFPFGYTAAASGEIIVMWGAPLGDGTGILAYERDAPALGGWVLLQNGNVKQLSAAEFRATPKAEK